MAKIEIFNPSNRMYGKLSNNYLYSMEIVQDGSKKFNWYLERYPTVSNFIYSNLLSNIDLRRQLITIKTKDVKAEYDKLIIEESKQIVRKAVDQAYSNKISQSDTLKTKLLSTGNAPIHYISDNPFLGIGPQRTGANIVGLYLEQIRSQLINVGRYIEEKKLKEKKDFELYEAYLANKELVREIENGNNLDGFVGKTPTEIIDLLGRSQILSKAPTQDIVVNQFFKQGILQPEIFLAVKNPHILVNAIRKKYYKDLPRILQNKKERIVFQMYAEYIVEKRFPDIKPEHREEAVKQQIDLKLTGTREMERRLYNLYTKGRLSERLSLNIDKELEKIIIPTEAEITEVEAYDITVADKPNPAGPQYKETKGEPINIYSDPSSEKEFSVFSIFDNSKIFTVGGRMYPTIEHYILVSKIASIFSPKLGEIGFENAYKYLLQDPKIAVTELISFLDYRTIVTRYHELYSKNTKKHLISLMQTALNKKFENREFQDVLLSTNNARLIWNDYSDPILGVGKTKNGDNLVGKYLMEIRERLRVERKDEKIDKLSIQDINSVLEKDPFLLEWLKMRINDMCLSILIVKKYTEEISENVKLTPKFVSEVLDKIYQPCSHIFATISQVKIPVPDFFSSIIRKFPDFHKVSVDVIKELWLRVAVILYNLIKYLKTVSVYDIRKILSSIEQMVILSNNCVRITEQLDNNCIISALINLMTGISSFNKGMGYTPNSITKKEVSLATSIILCADVSEQLDPSIQDDMVTGLEIHDKPVRKVGPTGLPQWDDDDEIEDKQVSELESERVDEFGSGRVDEFESEGGDEFESWGDPESEGGTSPKQNFGLIKALENLKEFGYNVDDPEGLVSYIDGAIDLIKTYNKIPKQVKKNRINFFATQI